MKRAILILLLGWSCAHAQTTVVFDSLEVHGFLDGVMETKLRDQHIAGAVLTVVHNGKVIFSQGYGYGNVSRQEPVFPDSTLFRIGSISKLFVWISVMQLVQQGKLDLNANVNQYLTDFKVPDTYPQPITLQHLMTHTAGFEDLLIGLFGRETDRLKTPAEILKGNLPSRVRPPGAYASYSNHGTALAAVIVEQVSGMNFNTYVEKNILGNLMMNRTTFRQPVPSSLPGTASVGYTWQKGDFEANGFEFVPLYPAGSASATGRDMANLMIALLDQGRLAPFRLLDSITWRQMLAPLHRHHPHVNPMRHGLVDISQNGVEIIGHGGATLLFHSLLAVFPAQQIGLFVSTNTNKGAGLGNQILEEFTDHYFPEQTLAQTVQLGREHLSQFAGVYLSNRHPHRDFTKVVSLLSSVRISIADSNRLRIQRGVDINYYVPLDSMLFREARSSRTIAFEKKNGKITKLFFGDLPIVVFNKVYGWYSPDMQLFTFLFIFVMALLTLLFWPITFYIRRGYQPLLRTRQSLPLLAKVFAWSNYCIWLIFVAGVSAVLSEPANFLFGISVSVKVLLVLPLTMMIITLFMAYACFRLVPDTRYRSWSRTYYVIITLVSGLALYQLYFWNLLGFKY